MNKHAQALGRLAKGKPKRFSQAYRKKLTKRLEDYRKLQQEEKK
jgi:hypothetical protein